MANRSGTEIDYVGSELDVFSHVKNWKAYWAKMIEPYLGYEVLDVGAGIGATAINLSSRKYKTWVELEPDPKLAERIKQGQKKGTIPASLEVRVGTAQDLQADEMFDTVLYIDVLEHIEEDRKELENIAKHVKQSGHVIVLSPAHQYLFTEFDRQVGHCRRYNKNQLRAIKPDNFEIVCLKYLDSVGMIASLGNKLLLKNGHPTLTQVKAWDHLMVPVSKIVDTLTAHSLGKSILSVYKKINKK